MFYQVFKRVQEMLPGVRVIRGLRVSKDIWPWLRWSKARPVPQSSDSRRPAETLLCCQKHISITQWAWAPRRGSLGPLSAKTLGRVLTARGQSAPFIKMEK